MKLKKLKKQEKILSRRKKESNRRKKQKLKVAIIHEKIKNCRKDFHHKLSTKIVDEIAVADAHPRGARPFGPEHYEQKFLTLTQGIIEESEARRFIDLARNVTALSHQELLGLNVVAKAGLLENAIDPIGIF